MATTSASFTMIETIRSCPGTRPLAHHGVTKTGGFIQRAFQTHIVANIRTNHLGELWANHRWNSVRFAGTLQSAIGRFYQSETTQTICMTHI